MQPFLTIFAVVVTSFAITFLVLNLLLKYSIALKLVDMPNERKLHKKPIPSIGGLIIMISLGLSILLNQPLKELVLNNPAFFSSLLALLILGVLDDRLDISASIRFFVEIIAAFWVAHSGMRLTSLYGIFGIYHLAVWAQYTLTILIVVGVTNAFNLIDGIDGLAGSMALVNLLVITYMAYVNNAFSWILLLAALITGLLVFLKYNWNPAKLFMGDGGSLVLGFFTATLGIYFIEKINVQNSADTTTMVALLFAIFIVPVIDTLRLFYVRIKKGKSPFSADKNHLHHWFVKQHLLHKQATKRMILFHISQIVFSIIFIKFFNITVVVIMLALMVLIYTKLLQLSNYFHRWYKLIKRMEIAN